MIAYHEELGLGPQELAGFHQKARAHERVILETIGEHLERKTEVQS